jgi:hypothetical protein
MVVPVTRYRPQKPAKGIQVSGTARCYRRLNRGPHYLEGEEARKKRHLDRGGDTFHGIRPH